ncbi:MAG TPA: helix-turn-helix domain-containing protein [Patescibacteria group bacterium]|nr:helix-turn-helix domain-containing protein [Patescibacteria group bacterium]
MLRSNLPRAVRELRRRHRWRQADLASRCGVSRQVISRIERGQLGSQSIRTLARVIEALDATAELVVHWRGEELDRLMDATHAALVQQTVAFFQSVGWVTRVEVSFNHFGDRGRVDVLALHRGARILAVVEVKSALGDLQDTAGRLDVKVRLGSMLASSIGWEQPEGVIRALVVADTRTARRVVERHAGIFDVFSLRGRRALAWVRSPSSPSPRGLLWFVRLPDALGRGVTRSARVRVDRNRP